MKGGGNREPYKVGIIGCGRVAWILEGDTHQEKPASHMGAYSRDCRVTVACGADTNPERLKAFGDAYEGVKLYSDYREMLTYERPHIVSITAYATNRCQMVLDAIEAGVKGIWCEKAIATSLKEAAAIKEAVDGSKTTLIVSHMRRWVDYFQYAKSLIDGGEIGTLKSVTSNFSSSLLHTGTHAFDVLLWFCGKPLWVEGTLEDRPGSAEWDGKEDLGGRAHIEFEGGHYAAVHGESKGYFIFEFDFIGTEGRIRLGNNGMIEVYRAEESEYWDNLKELTLQDLPEFEYSTPEGNIWTKALSNLIGAMEGTEEVDSGVDDGYSSLELGLAVHRSALDGGARVDIPLKDKELKVINR